MPPRCSKAFKPTLLRLLLFVTFMLQSADVGAIDAKCSACLAVVDELNATLIREKPHPTNSMKVGGRLGANGKRDEKVIDWRTSETRVIDILEEVCKGMDSYSLSNWQDNKKGGVPMHWQKVGIGNDMIITEAVTLGASNDLQKKELSNWCYATVEKNEDAIVQAIQSERDDLTFFICEDKAKACVGEDREAEYTRRSNDAKHMGNDSWMKKLKEEKDLKYGRVKPQAEEPVVKKSKKAKKAKKAKKVAEAEL